MYFLRLFLFLWVIDHINALCENSDFGATDPYGDGCEWYDLRITQCGLYDDADFQALDMCCSCGGGLLQMEGPPKNRAELRFYVNKWILNSSDHPLGDISGWNTSRVKDFSMLFKDKSNFNADLSGWDTSKVTSLYYTFEGASAFNGDISKWNTSSVMRLDLAFGRASSFNADLSGWDTSRVRNLIGTFNHAESFNGDLSGWDTSKVTTLAGTFQEASAFNGDISKWNTSSVMRLNSTFERASSFNADLSGWDTSRVTTLYATFARAISFNGDISRWITSRVESLHDTFHVARSFNGDISGWDTSSVRNLIGTFNEAQSFNGDLSGWDTSKVTTLLYVFRFTFAFNGDISKWNTSRVTDLEGVFYYATSFNGNLSGWDTSKMTSLYYTFEWAISFNGDISRWDTSSVKNLDSTFKSASSFNADLSGWDTSKVTSLYYTFEGALAFNADLSGWDTSKVTTLAGTFREALAFNADLSGWDTSKVTTLGLTFGSASNFNADLSDWDTLKVTTLAGTFYNAAAFTGDGVSNWNTSSVTTLEGTFRDATSFTGEGVSNWDTSSVTTFKSTFRGTTSFVNGNNLILWNVTNVVDWTNTFQEDTLTTCSMRNIYDSFSVQSQLFATFFMSWEYLALCECKVGQDPPLSIAIESWLRGRTSHLVCGEDIADWDTSKASSLSHHSMCGELVTCNNLDFTKTPEAESCPGLESSCTDSHIFSSACCICGGGITQMSCAVNLTNFEGDLSQWNVQGVTDMSQTFKDMVNFNSDLSRWDVSNVLNMREMFSNAKSFNSDLSRWCVQKVVDMYGIFDGATALDICNRGSICKSWGLAHLTDCKNNSYPDCDGDFESVTNQAYGDCGFNTENCTCNEIDGSMTTRYCVDNCGTIPYALGHCANLKSLQLSDGRLQGPIPNELTRLKNLVLLDVSENKLQKELPDQIGDLKMLRKLDVSNNILEGFVPNSLSLLTSLEYLYLDNNRFKGELNLYIFSNLTSLKELYLSFNMFEGSVPYLHNHRQLKTLMLHSNSFNKIRNGTFAGSISLDTLSLARQSKGVVMELEVNAFRDVSAKATIVLSGNIIEEIPTGAFSGLKNAVVDLQSLGIHTIHTKAFAETTNLTILLQGNSVYRIFPDAFPNNAIRDAVDECVDYDGWTEMCRELEKEATCDQMTCSTGISPYNVIHRGVSAVYACCALEGGHRGGITLMMDSTSSIYCSYNGHVECACSLELERYDVKSSKCVSSCDSGMMWSSSEIQNRYEMIVSQQGTCVECPAGRTSPSRSWICQNLPSGQYGAGEACSPNTYSGEGAAECTNCPSGKYSNIGASECLECDFMYLLSRRCDVPIMGALVFSGVLVILVILSLIFYRYQRQQKLKQSILQDKMKIRQLELVGIKKDVELLSEAWNMDWKDIHLGDEPVARGSFGEVWHGLYRGKWEVAVKKMFDTESLHALADESEIHFLQRARHPRLVLFMGAGRMPSGNLFLVLEFMEEGALDSKIEKLKTSFLWSDRVRIIADIADGMAFLHDRHDSVHRDLKCGNVLLSRENGVLIGKIGDFGMSRFVSKNIIKDQPKISTNSSTDSVIEMKSNEISLDASFVSVPSNRTVTMTSGLGTPTNMAPEVWAGMESGKKTSRLTKKVDVYAFSIIMWEVLECRPAWTEFNFLYKISRQVLKGGRPKISDSHLDTRSCSSPSNYISLMEKCWTQNPAQRPSFSEIFLICSAWGSGNNNAICSYK